MTDVQTAGRPATVISTDATVPEARFDAVVVGAGFAGMYMLHRLRQQGLSVLVLDGATDVGGTWYWNRYPGARCDVPSMEYSYSWSEELQQEWQWSEVMSPQPEILAYAQHVADRFDLRRDIRFATTVRAAHFDESTDTWVIATDAGDRLRATYCIMATGALSASNTPDLPGLDRFGGELLHTGRWPKAPVALDRRVGVIGTGSSGVQAIPVIAEQAEHLFVLQRTPVFTFPANNKPLRPDVQSAYKDHYDEVRRRQRHSPNGFSGWSPVKVAPKQSTAGPRPARPELRTLSPEQRHQAWEQYGFRVFDRFRDVYKDMEANELACELYRDHVRSVVRDPDVAERLLPKDYPLGCKRQVLDSGYYETFNRPNVTLVDLRDEALVEITETGVRTTKRHIELDVLVLATGFDAMTGALDRIDIRGRGGVTLKEHWAAGPRTYLGLQVAGFPNLFTVTGPGSPSVLSNVIVAIEQHVEWIDDCIGELRRDGLRTIETTPDAEEAWGRHVTEVAQDTMYVAPGCSSWYLGANIPGKPRVFMPYVGGLGRYRARCDEIVANGYEGFVLR
ncbi:MAG: NAD(P)/FAD-dependent oxidoreductase [Acidimicrobiales bacterium]|nr:NAD(P)/FAD-dependent oxidoreductase [Acidimicrobiales bacterium]